MNSSKVAFKSLSVIVAVVMLLGLSMSAPVRAQEGMPPGDRVLLGNDSGGIQFGQELTGVTKEFPLDKNGMVNVVVELTDAPAVVTYANSAQVGSASSVQAAQSQLTRIMRAQDSMRQQLTSSKFGAEVIYSVQRVYNGIAIRVDARKLGALRKLPGVKALHPLVTKKLDNSYAVPLLGAPQVWNLSAGSSGEGIDVAIIDTGIDYTHANFGGPGTAEAYTSNNPAVVEAGSFPTLKVVGGHDFAGDAYDADATGPAAIPVPDDDPLDCGGHGSHVAGTVGGFGVDAEGETYAGPYDAAVDFSTFSIGPGVAPKVNLYALKVFGCEGSTNVTDLAIEWAVDPNEDGDFTDHLDLINMSLGSSYGSSYDSSAVAAENAALAGIIVVASSGNSGDSNYVTGSPAVATRVISTAASIDAGEVLDGFKVESATGMPVGVYPSSNSVAYDWVAKPNVTADLVYPATNRGGCAPFPAGTFTGKVALLDWTHNPDGSNVCGSVGRSGNAYNAGAVGVIMAYDLPILDISITGSAYIPATITTLAVGDQLKAALAQGTVRVSVTDEYNASVVNVDESMTDLVASFSSRGPRRGDSFLKPDITAPGMTIFSTLVGSGYKGQSMNGTSMAAPNMTGVMALLRKLHPTWTVEELKALAMNTAFHPLYTGLSQSGDLYGVGLVGAGRADAALAADASLIVYNADDDGAVSVSFGAPEVVSTWTMTKAINLVNKSGTQKTVTLNFDVVNDMPGVSVELQNASGQPVTGSVNVPGNGSLTLKLKMSADAALMKHAYDITLTNLGARDWLGEEAGYLVVSEGEAAVLRLPYYATPRLASQTELGPYYLARGQTTGSTSVSITGTGVNTVIGSGALLEDVISAASVLELVDTLPQEFAVNEAGSNADIQYIGVASDALNPGLYGPVVDFGIAAYGRASTPNDVEFDIYIDSDQDGSEDYVLFNWNYGAALGGDPSDLFVVVLFDLNAKTMVLEDYLNGVRAGAMDMASFNSGVMTLPAYLSDFDEGDGQFDFYVASFSRDYDGFVDLSNLYTYDALNPVLDTSGGYAGVPLYYDKGGSEVPVNFDFTAVGKEPSLLVLHHHNAFGSQAEVVDFGRLMFLPAVRR